MEGDALLLAYRLAARSATRFFTRWRADTPAPYPHRPVLPLTLRYQKQFSAAHVWGTFLPLVMLSQQPALLEEDVSRSLKAKRGKWYLQHGVASIQGHRPTMEDRHFCIKGFKGDSEKGLFGVFDGHGGIHAANYACERIPQSLESNPELYEDPSNALHFAIAESDRQFCSYARSMGLPDGTTALVAYIDGKDVYVANVGDSRAVLCSGGQAKALSRDHKPELPDEYARISALGGTVRFAGGCHRVNGRLAMSRAIGDAHLKPIVTATPEIVTHRLGEEDEFLILACDGLWDVVENQEAVDFVKSLRTEDPSIMSRSLCEFALQRGSTDNITVVVVLLSEPNMSGGIVSSWYSSVTSWMSTIFTR
eukprot:Rmarinus@m.5653